MTLGARNKSNRLHNHCREMKHALTRQCEEEHA